MFLISKRKIIIILCFTTVGICVYLSLINLLCSKKTQATATLSSNKIVIVDAGHGGEDGGAVSKNGVKESDINLKIALKLQNLLEENGTTVILTRSTENAIYDEGMNTLRQKKVSDIKNRVEIGNNSNADIFISIHLNKIPQEKYYGWQCFFKETNESSKKLAKSIQQALNETMEIENKREALKIKGIYIIDNVKIPTTIVECGFLSNEKEEQLLQTEEYQEKLAQGIYKGINNYFGD